MIRSLQRDVIHKVFREAPRAVQDSATVRAAVVRALGVNVKDVRDAEAFYLRSVEHLQSKGEDAEAVHAALRAVTEEDRAAARLL